ncbi:MAG: group III truncated hemoglobin [Pseudomonadota bacterium]
MKPQRQQSVDPPCISEEQIALLVERFYDQIWQHPRLGPMFTSRVADRPAHLAKMKRFWSSVLLKTGQYSGRPLPVHMKISEMAEADFAVWLSIFRPTARSVFSAADAEHVIQSAERIARSFWMARYGGLTGSHIPTTALATRNEDGTGD